MKKPSFIIGKKQIILSCLTLMLAIAVYVNYAMSDGKLETAQVQSKDSVTYGDTAFVNAEANQAAEESQPTEESEPADETSGAYSVNGDAEETAAETAPTMDMDSASAEQHVAETTASDVQTVTDGFTSVAVDVRQEQSVSAAQEEVPDLHVLPPQQEEAAEELAEQPQAASYTADMDVSEITQRMTVDEAKAVVVQIGTCRGWTLEQVAQRRPASLKWYLYGCDQADNILKAAASVLLDNLQQKAG